MVLKILNSTLTHSLPRNPHLIYALLYQQNLFEDFNSHERFGSLVSNIVKVISFFNTALEKASSEEWSSSKVLEIIKAHSLAWKSDYMIVRVDIV
jgi:hypothetical protein